MHEPFDRISVDPAVRFGKPCVRGMRVTVGDVVGYLAGGMSEAEVLSQFPQLASDDIKACHVAGKRSGPRPLAQSICVLVPSRGGATK